MIIASWHRDITGWCRLIHSVLKRHSMPWPLWKWIYIIYIYNIIYIIYIIYIYMYKMSFKMTNIINMILASEYYCNMFFSRFLGYFAKTKLQKTALFPKIFWRHWVFFLQVLWMAVQLQFHSHKVRFLRQKNIWGSRATVSSPILKSWCLLISRKK